MFPAPSLRELARPKGVTEGVYFDEWYSVKSSEFRRGDENRPQRRILASTRLNGASPIPAPSLRELLSAAKLRECRSMVPPGRWFTRKPLLALKFLSGYEHQSTPPRVGAGGNIPPQRQSPARWMFRQRAGDFCGFCVGVFFPFNRVLAKPWGCGRFSSPLRKLCNFLPVTSIGGHSLSLAFARQLPQGGSRGRWGCAIHRGAR